MIPRLVTISHRRPDGRWRRLFIPVIPVLVLLSPLLLLAVLGGLVACLMYRVSFVGALRGAVQLMCALPGTRVDIDDGHLAFLVSVS